MPLEKSGAVQQQRFPNVDSRWRLSWKLEMELEKVGEVGPVSRPPGSTVSEEEEEVSQTRCVFLFGDLESLQV